MTDAEARELRKVKAEVVDLKAQVLELQHLVDWYRSREHQQYLDTNPEWVEQIEARHQVVVQASPELLEDAAPIAAYLKRNSINPAA